METSFGSDELYNFLKLIIETGGVHYIDAEHLIRYSLDDSPIGIQVGSHKDAIKRVCLYKENMKVDPDNELLNPFVEYVGKYPAKDWFFNYVETLPGCLIRETIKGIANLMLSDDKDVGFKGAKLLANFSGRFDKKFLDELQKVRTVDIATIYYSREHNTAQMTSAFWEDEYATKMKTKLRKSSVMLIKDIISTMLETDNPRKLTYKATLIGCPRFDATIHLLVQVFESIDKIFSKIYPEVNLHVTELKGHLDHIEAYHKAMQWLSSSTGTMVEKKSGPTTVSEMKEAPWHVAVRPDGTATGNVSSCGIENARIAGAVVNPNFQTTPTITPNPTFCNPVTNMMSTMPMTPVMPSLGEFSGVRPVLPTFHTPVPTFVGGMPSPYGMPMAAGF